jgi:hypothetical protein
MNTNNSIWNTNEGETQQKLDILTENNNWEKWEYILIKTKEQVENFFLLNIDTWVSWLKAKLLESLQITIPDIEEFLEFTVFWQGRLETWNFEDLSKKINLFFDQYNDGINNKINDLNNDFNSQKEELKNQGIFLYEDRYTVFEDSWYIHKTLQDIENIFYNIQSLNKEFINDLYNRDDEWISFRKINNELMELKELFNRFFNYIEWFDVKNELSY